MHVIATAGHVDHGKSTLVKALTGTDPDRFAEEKARGLTIDLGFAHAVLPSGRAVDVIDVPGHIRFIANMLAGIGAVDSCLFVMDAREGWKPQSEEHLRILSLVGVHSGVVALTKVGLVDEARRERAHDELNERLEGSFLASAEIVPVDSPTGVGLVALTVALDRLLDVVPRSVNLGRPRLWVDRSFTVVGAGTVVTGTLAGGCIEVGDELRIVGPGSAAGRKVRIRGIQTHGFSQYSVEPGCRVALNLIGVAQKELPRGVALVRACQWELTSVIDVDLQVLKGLAHPVTRRGAFKLYLGSGEYSVSMRPIGRHEIAPGEQGMARLWLPVALPLVPGDRFLLRESGRSETVGGGEVLDIAPLLPVARAQPSRSIDRVVADRGWVDVDLLARLTGEEVQPTIENWVVEPNELAAFRENLLHHVEDAGLLGLDLAELDERGRVLVRNTDSIVIHAGRAFLASTRADSLAELADHPWLVALRRSAWTPADPNTFGVEPAVVRELVRNRQVVERNGVYFSPQAVEDAGRVIARMLASSPDGVTVASVRNALGTTRKFTLPLLAELDATGVTRRRGNLRLGGPRLPAG